VGQGDPLEGEQAVQPGKFNVIVDQAWGSSGKGKVSTWLADHFGVEHVSSSNFPNAGHCQTFDTRVITDRGIRQLGEIVASGDTGIRILNMHGQWESVADLVDDGVRMINEVILKNGVTFRCTDEHKYYVWDMSSGSRQWVRSMDLDPDTHQFLFPKKTEYVGVSNLGISTDGIGGKPNKTDLEWDDVETIRFAEYLGLLVGDGFYNTTSPKVDIAFHTSQLDVLTYIQGMYEKLGLSKGYVYQIGDKECVVLSQTQISDLRNVFEQVGLKLTTGINKSIPVNVLRASPKIIGAFLRGLFDADGSVKTRRVGLSNVSESVVKDTQHLLFMLGINSTYKYYDDSRSGRNRVHYLDIAGHGNLKLFRERVGFLSKVKSARLDVAIGDYNPEHSVGSLVRTDPDIRDVIYEHTECKYGFAMYSTSNIVKHSEQLIDAGRGELVVTARDYHVVDIKHVHREVGKEQVFDITVPDTHSYLANSAISHNTTVFGDNKFVAKAIPTAAFLRRAKGKDIISWISPQSGFFPERLVQEFEECGCPEIKIHGRASIVTPEHAAMERGERGDSSSTKHIASTMQGSAAAMCQKIMRRPDTVLARDVLEWPEGVEVLSGAEFRKNVYLLIAGGGTWLHEGSQGYALSIDHGSHYPFCLSWDSRVLMADGTTKRIRHIKEGDIVLSLTEDGKYVEKPVINWWQHAVADRKWYNVITDVSYKHMYGDWVGAKYTGDHKVKTANRGVVRVDELTTGDELFTTEHKIDGEAQQILLGSMLGDGACPTPAHTPSNTVVLEISHGSKQTEYLEAKAQILSRVLGGSTREAEYGEGSFKPGNTYTRYSSNRRQSLMRMASNLGCIGHKTPDIEAIFDTIDARGLAIWYQDDGSYKCKKDVMFYTNGFTVEEVERIVDCMADKFEFTCSIDMMKCGSGSAKSDKKTPVLRLSRKDHDRFFSMVAPYVHPVMSYKLPDKYEARWQFTGEDEITAATVMVFAVEEVVVDSNRRRDKNLNSCYDIEVEGTHNFFVSNGAGYVNVENCTSRNCSLQAAMDHMAVPPKMVGDVYMNIRPYPIRVGSIKDDSGSMVGYSGDCYPDQEEVTWGQVAERAGMPEGYAEVLKSKEFTTVTLRLRRVFTWSRIALIDAAYSNGVTKLCLNFAQYIDWSDNGKRGEGKKGLESLSSKTRAFIDQLENDSNCPVVFIGTGADHDDVINLL